MIYLQLHKNAFHHGHLTECKVGYDDRSGTCELAPLKEKVIPYLYDNPIGKNERMFEPVLDVVLVTK